MYARQQQTVLVVDDEHTVREVVRRYLELDGFQVEEADTGPLALQRIETGQYDLIILDVMLPGLDGISITRKLRNPAAYAPLRLNGDVPIILLTARTDEMDRLNGFDVGADDYIPKPFSPRELVARVKAVLRRSSNSATSTEKPIEYQSMSLDPRGRTVMVDGQEVGLTAKEFDLLWFLARHPRQVFSRAQLLDHVWGYEFYGDESTVTVHVRRLREKVEPNPAEPVYIQTVWGVGYKFNTPEF